MLSLLGTLLDKIYPFALHSYEANEFKVVTHYLPLHEVVFKYCLSVPVFLVDSPYNKHSNINIST